MQGVVTNIQPFSLHDGPGIRTTVFMKGCNMQCLWCHNPETISFEPELFFFQERCIGCGVCRAACETGPLSQIKGRCTACFTCVSVCPTKAKELSGQSMSAEDAFAQVAADLPYYNASGGGVTISGGEPLLQPDFVLDLLKRCRAAGIHTAVETNLSVSFGVLQAVLPYVDLLLFDVKLADDAAHIAATGVSNQQIRYNLSRLDEMCSAYIARTPLIPTVTDTPANITAIAGLLAPLNHLMWYELLKYNVLAPAKYALLGKNYPLNEKHMKDVVQPQYLAEATASQGVTIRYTHLSKDC